MIIKKPKPKTKKKQAQRSKFWEKLKGTYQPVAPFYGNNKKLQADVERLIAAVQQDLMWDDKDIATWHKIQAGHIDWSGQIANPKRKIKKKNK